MPPPESPLPAAWNDMSRPAHLPELHELLTVEDVVHLLKVSKSWVYEHTRSCAMPREERLPHIRIGKYLRFEAQAVLAFLARKAKATS